MYVCAQTSINVRAERCVSSSKVGASAAPSSERLLVQDADRNGRASTCGDQYSWIKVQRASGAIGHVAARFVDSCSPTRKRATSKVVVSTLYAVHCVQKYGGDGNVCAGNSHSKVALTLYEQQQRIRLDGEAAGALRLNEGAAIEDVRGAVRALQHVCNDISTYPSDLPVMTTAFALSLRNGQLQTDFAGSAPWRTIFSPMMYELTAAQHQLKIDSVMTALNWGPLLMTLYICDDMSARRNSPRVVTFANCPRERPKTLVHRVILTGYHRGATLDSSYFIFQNSWSEYWGYSGFGRLSMAQSTSFFWGSVNMMLVREHDNVFNPFFPDWKNEVLDLRGDRFSLTAGGASCADDTCSLSSSSSTVYYTPKFVVIDGRVLGHDFPDGIAFSELKLTLTADSASAAANSLSVLLIVTHNDGTIAQQTTTVSPSWQSMAGGRKMASITITQPSSQRMVDWRHFSLQFSSSSSSFGPLKLTSSQFQTVDNRRTSAFRDSGVVLEDDASQLAATTALSVAAAASLLL